MRKALVVALIVAGVGAESPAQAYLKLGTLIDGRVVDASWGVQPISYFVSERDGTGVSAGELRDAVARAAATWQNVADTDMRFAYQGMTSASPDATDGRSTIGFLERPDLDRVLGYTSLLIDTTTGAIVEADVFFNTQFTWSVSPAGESGRVDLESVALHELGHMLGLGHSGLGETERIGADGRRVVASGAVMFPIAMSAGVVVDRVLQADDIAGVSDSYPVPGLAERTGGLRGRVTKNGRGVYGAHVIAFSPASGALVATFALDAGGEFAVTRLPPGAYVIRVEPLDDADTDSFFAGSLDLDFRVTYASRMVVAPRGGSSAPVEIKVLSK